MVRCGERRVFLGGVVVETFHVINRSPLDAREDVEERGKERE
jgi:hypothetical protein